MKTPITRKRSWACELVLLSLLGLMILLWYLLLRNLRHALTAGALTYLVTAWTLRLTLQGHQRRGIRLLRQDRLNEALSCFEKSDAFFARHPWVDQYRAITMFSSSAYGYREMALQNQVHVLLRLNRVEEAMQRLEKLIAIAPGREELLALREQVQTYLAQKSGSDTPSAASMEDRYSLDVPEGSSQSYTM